LDQISGLLRDEPAGRIRLLVPRLAAMSVLAPKSRDSHATIRNSCWTSPPTTAGSTLLPEASTQAFMSGEFIQSEFVVPGAVGNAGEQISRVRITSGANTIVSNGVLGDPVNDLALIGCSILALALKVKIGQALRYLRNGSQ
jgi:hypothetical protein